MYKMVTIIVTSLLLTSCANSPATRGNGGSTYATRDAEVVFDNNEQTYPRIALVIGNNDYKKHKKLTNAVPDARAMRDFLIRKDFKVVYAEDATQDVIKSKIKEFLNGLGKKSIAFVYYAGHATQDKSRKTKQTTNYILPINDTTLDKYITDYDNDAISFNNILNKMDETNHGLNIAMLDACRTPIGRGGAIENIGAEGVYLVYSTASGVTASDNGAFRRSFLKHAKQPLKLTDILEKVKLDLRNKGQRPSIQNDIVGTFYFTQVSKPIPTLTPVVKPQVVERTFVFEPKPVRVVSTSKWITPKDSVCRANGGKIDKHGVCEANWKNAKQICSASGGRLPTKEKLGKVVTDCGGSLTTRGDKDWDSLTDKNINNSHYQNSYKEKGFSRYDAYWSSTTHASLSNDAWIVDFYYGGQYYGNKDFNGYVRCVRAGE